MIVFGIAIALAMAVSWIVGVRIALTEWFGWSSAAGVTIGLLTVIPGIKLMALTVLTVIGFWSAVL